MKNKKGSIIITAWIIFILLVTIIVFVWAFFYRENIPIVQQSLNQSEKKNQTVITEGWKIFKNENQKFEVGYPGNWKADNYAKDQELGFNKDFSTYLHDPNIRPSDRIDGYGGSLEIVVFIEIKAKAFGPDSKEVKVPTLDEWKKFIAKKNGPATGKFKVLENEKISGVSCAAAEDVNYLYRYCIKDGKGYQFEMYVFGEKDLALGKKIISTFKFTN